MIARPPDRLIYVIRLRPNPGVDAIHSLRLVLKYLLRRFGMRAASVEEKKVGGEA